MPLIVSRFDHSKPDDESNHNQKLYDVPKLEADKIVDTNGAGDSFVGGFLARLAQGHTLDIAVYTGIHFASAVV